MKITVLTENNAVNDKFTAEHGLSLFVQLEEYNFLFDAGQTNAFEKNAFNCSIDLTQAAFAVLSHGHYDHSGGMLRFMEINNHAKLYLNKYAFDANYNAEMKYIGINPLLASNDRLVFTDDKYEIRKNCTLYSCNSSIPVLPIESYGLTSTVDKINKPDTFRHEQYLLIEENGKKILISGCSHKGIINIVNWFEPDILIGGFHFMKIDTDVNGKNILEKYAQELLKYNTLYYTCHCTGDEQYEILKNIMGNSLNRIRCGDVFYI